MLVAAGESQSAFALVTYYNGVQPLTQAFDGFFVHSRGGVAMGLVGPGESADLAGAIGGGGPSTFRTISPRPCSTCRPKVTSPGSSAPPWRASPTPIASGCGRSPAPPTSTEHLLGASAQYIDCGYPINNGPLDVVAKAGLRALVDVDRDRSGAGRGATASS